MSGALEFLNDVKAFASGPLSQAAQAWTLGGAPEQVLYDQAARLGLTGLTIPTELGGQGHGFDTLVAACEELAAVDFGFAMSLINSHNVGLRLCQSANERVRDAHLSRVVAGEVSACTALTEPGTGSDFAAITTRAVECKNSWRISGEKMWIVNGRHAELAIVFAQCAEVGDASGIGGFAVDLRSPGVRRYPVESGFSQASMGTGGFRLDEVAVDADTLLLPPGTAFKSILTEINAARTYVAAMCNAMLARALEQAWAYGARRRSFGKTLDQHQGWRHALGVAETDLAASRALTGRAVALVSSGEDAQLAAAEAKVVAVQTGQRHLPELLHAMGAAGLLPEYCFTRHLAAVQIAGFTDGATSILQDRVAKLSRAREDNPKR